MALGRVEFRPGKRNKEYNLDLTNETNENWSRYKILI